MQTLHSENVRQHKLYLFSAKVLICIFDPKMKFYAIPTIIVKFFCFLSSKESSFPSNGAEGNAHGIMHHSEVVASIEEEKVVVIKNS